jgi:hypothetical protein
MQRGRRPLGTGHGRFEVVVPPRSRAPHRWRPRRVQVHQASPGDSGATSPPRRVAGSAQHGDDERRLLHLAAGAIDHREAVARIIDQELCTSAVVLSHDESTRAGPGAIRLTKPTVRAALWRGGLVCLPEQEQGAPFAFEFAMARGPVGDQTCPRGRGWGGWKQEPLEGGIIQGCRQGPCYARAWARRTSSATVG